MAGQPKTRAAFAVIAQKGGENYIFGRIAEGCSLKQIAEELGITRPLLSTWCNQFERRDAYAHARQLAADALVDEGMSILDAASPENIQVAKARSDYRKYLASRLNPHQWAEKPKSEEKIDWGAMHLEAVKLIKPDWTPPIDVTPEETFDALFKKKRVGS